MLSEYSHKFSFAVGDAIPIIKRIYSCTGQAYVSLKTSFFRSFVGKPLKKAGSNIKARYGVSFYLALVRIIVSNSIAVFAVVIQYVV